MNLVKMLKFLVFLTGSRDSDNETSQLVLQCVRQYCSFKIIFINNLIKIIMFNCF